MSISFPHALAVWRRDAAMYRRTWWLNILPNFFEPVLYLAAIGIGVGGYISQMGGMSYLQFLAPGLLCVAAMNGASFEVTYNIYVRLTFEKSYDAMLTTPIEPDDVLVGEVLWAITRSCIYGGCFFVVIGLWGLVPRCFSPSWRPPGSVHRSRFSSSCWQPCRASSMASGGFLSWLPGSELRSSQRWEPRWVSCRSSKGRPTGWGCSPRG